MLIGKFHVNKREGTRKNFEPLTLRIVVLHLTNCAISTTAALSHSRQFYCENQTVEREKLVEAQENCKTGLEKIIRTSFGSN